MRAWRLDLGGFELVEVPRPRVPAEGVLVEVAAAGLCHTDVMHLDLGPAHLPVSPMTLGHETAGRIVEVGAAVTGWAVGDRVAVLASEHGPGSARDGGYADAVVAYPHELVEVPDEVDDATAAVATDAGVTAYRAVLVQGRVQAGMTVGIIGLGGLGMIGARLAHLAGATVYGADVKESLFSLAGAQGVKASAPSLAVFEDVSFDVVVDFAGVDTTGGAFRAVRPGGRVVQVGIGRPSATIDLFDVLVKQLEYVGSNTGSVEELAAFLRLVARGEITPEIERIPVGEIGAGLERLRRGEVTGRLVAMP
ncbi:alcohol dehydrogenase AdhP [Pseudonocardia halophobica]|uniref:Zinc-dependent alcohol dehydrogenase n=1 Tax=Pseudonocardia halophobica TaxID=29401 RepID=A0A9W6NVG8_9PSEU|nr:alcohol dehydrogenase catalytic domain-containing protein [Pseudonocardia halophobica]GLL10526.1 zinc-dependent alcohol dehydrogenase [Pseudonocardia halophobica]